MVFIAEVNFIGGENLSTRRTPHLGTAN